MMTIAAMTEIAYHAGNSPWPPLDTASKWFDRASFVLAFTLLVGFSATVVIIWMGIVKEHHWDLLREQSVEKVAALELETAKANESAAKANERTALAEIRLEETRKGVAKKRVLVSHAPDDPESFFLAMSIMGALKAAEWDHGYLGETSASVKMCGANLGGVLVLSHSVSNEEQEEMPHRGVLPKDRKTPWLALTDALWESIGADSTGFATCPSVPEGVLQVVVAPRRVFLK